jgi:hypothetical protein
MMDQDCENPGAADGGLAVQDFYYERARFRIFPLFGGSGFFRLGV